MTGGKLASADLKIVLETSPLEWGQCPRLIVYITEKAKEVIQQCAGIIVSGQYSASEQSGGSGVSTLSTTYYLSKNKQIQAIWGHHEISNDLAAT